MSKLNLELVFENQDVEEHFLVYFRILNIMDHQLSIVSGKKREKHRSCYRVFL